MDSKIINWKEEFIKLFPEETVRELKDNHIWCDKCDGVGFYRNGNKVSFCTKCNGEYQIALCENNCGNLRKKYYNKCEECCNKEKEEMI